MPGNLRNAILATRQVQSRRRIALPSISFNHLLAYSPVRPLSIFFFFFFSRQFLQAAAFYIGISVRSFWGKIEAGGVCRTSSWDPRRRASTSFRLAKGGGLGKARSKESFGCVFFSAEGGKGGRARSWVSI